MLKEIIKKNESIKPNSREIEILKENFGRFFNKDASFDFNRFKDMLEENNVEFTKEGYELNFLGKSYARLQVGAESKTVITPDIKHNQDEINKKSENLYIVGDNLDGLKHLAKSYSKKIKVIYIDPPYNTGNNDFVYPDNFEFKAEDLAIASNITEEEAQRILNMAGTSTHSAWLTFIYPRLTLALELLRDDGVIFISIGDDEQANLKLICDELFGEFNFVAQLVWEKKKKGSYLANDYTSIKEYILVYCKSKNYFEGLIGEVNTDTETYPCINADNPRSIRKIYSGIKSKYREKDYFLAKGNVISDTTMNLVLHSDLVIKDGVLSKELIIEGNWRYSQESMNQYSKNKELYITRDLYIRRIVSEPRNKGLKDLLLRCGDNDENSKIAYKDIDSNDELDSLNNTGWGSNEDADEEQRRLLGVQGLMSYPKPTKLILKLLSSVRDKNAIVLDFFSGSATTAHAVMKLNSIDNGNRKFIMVQIPEDMDKALNNTTTSNKEKYKKIVEYLDTINKPHLLSEIGIQRIKSASKQIEEETKTDIDYGFKIFSLNTPNQQTLDKIISFDSIVDTVIDENYVDMFNFNGVEGRETILQTWKVDDGYGFNAKHIVLNLNEYEAYLCEDTLYMINDGISSNDIMNLIEKIENQDIIINRIVLFGYSFPYTQLEELKRNISLLKNVTGIRVIERF